jgi:hypothetical protein
MNRVSRLGQTVLLLASAGLACGILNGCDRQTEASTAVQNAGSAISGIAAGGGSGSAPSVAVEGFTDAKRALEGTPDGTAAEKASVQILKSRSQAGLAAGLGLKINTLEQQAVAQMADLRGLARRWQSLHAEADAAESYDPGPELTLLANEAKEIEALIESATSAKAAIDARLADLRGQIEGLQAASKSERDKAAELELRASTMTAREAAEIAPQIATHAHAADLKLLDVSRLTARTNQLETEAREASLTLDKFVQQRSLLGDSQSEIRQVKQDATSEASAARAKAAAIGGELRERSQALLDFRSGKGEAGLNALYEEQIAGLTSAVSSARQAEADMRVNAKFARGSANLALGDAHAKRARSFAALAHALGGLAAVNPPLPESGWFGEQASRAESEVKRSEAAALEAYGAAADDFGAAGGRGSSREKLDLVIGKLNDLTGRSSGSGDAGEMPDDAGGEWPGEGEAGEGLDGGEMDGDGDVGG